MLNNFTEQYPYSNDDLIQKVAYTAGGQAEYVGRARPGTADSAAAWQIHKFTYDANGRMVSKLFADGKNDYANAWEDRAELTYS